MPKVVLVTGGSSGIGEAIAKELSASSKYKVYATSRRASNGEVINGINFLRIDIADPASIKEAAGYLLEREKRIDVLVNNAGVGFAGPLEETRPEEITEVFAINVFGSLEMCRAVIPAMRRQGSGQIINISSIAGRVGLPFRGVYSASKFALEGLSESLSQELRQFGITVTIVEPGGFATNITENRKTTTFSEGSVYKAQFDVMYKLMNDELRQAEKPERLALKIREIIEDPSPALRYVVSNTTQRLPLILKHILPSRFFEKLLMNHFKIPAR